MTLVIDYVPVGCYRQQGAGCGGMPRGRAPAAASLALTEGDGCILMAASEKVTPNVTGFNSKGLGAAWRWLGACRGAAKATI